MRRLQPRCPRVVVPERSPGAILNQDNSVNAPDRPAARGQVVPIYSTGLGPLATSEPDDATIVSE